MIRLMNMREFVQNRSSVVLENVSIHPFLGIIGAKTMVGMEKLEGSFFKHSLVVLFGFFGGRFEIRELPHVGQQSGGGPFVHEEQWRLAV